VREVSSHRVCSLSELPPGARRIVKLDGGPSIGLFNVDGELHAIRNICPHHGAELCLGATSGTMRASAPGEWCYDAEAVVLRCPRHRWEFTLRDGRSVIDPDRYRVRVYPVGVVNGDIHVEVPR
jgi:nitrite reductase (NADH) small subunit